MSNTQIAGSNSYRSDEKQMTYLYKMWNNIELNNLDIDNGKPWCMNLFNNQLKMREIEYSMNLVLHTSHRIIFRRWQQSADTLDVMRHYVH